MKCALEAAKIKSQLLKLKQYSVALKHKISLSIFKFYLKFLYQSQRIELFFNFIKSNMFAVSFQHAKMADSVYNVEVLNVEERLARLEPTYYLNDINEERYFLIKSLRDWRKIEQRVMDNISLVRIIALDSEGPRKYQIDDLPSYILVGLSNGDALSFDIQQLRQNRHATQSLWSMLPRTFVSVLGDDKITKVGSNIFKDIETDFDAISVQRCVDLRVVFQDNRHLFKNDLSKQKTGLGYIGYLLYGFDYKPVQTKDEYKSRWKDFGLTIPEPFKSAPLPNWRKPQFLYKWKSQDSKAANGYMRNDSVVVWAALFKMAANGKDNCNIIDIQKLLRPYSRKSFSHSHSRLEAFEGDRDAASSKVELELHGGDDADKKFLNETEEVKKQARPPPEYHDNDEYDPASAGSGQYDYVTTSPKRQTAANRSSSDEESEDESSSSSSSDTRSERSEKGEKSADKRSSNKSKDDDARSFRPHPNRPKRDPMSVWKCPTFDQNCIYCGSSEHTKYKRKRGSEINCDKYEGKYPTKCSYPICRDQNGHLVAVCGTLHNRCEKCKCRGHNGQCDEDDHKTLRALFERYADYGLYTKQRKTAVEWGYFRVPKCAYMKLSELNEFITFQLLAARGASQAQRMLDDFVPPSTLRNKIKNEKAKAAKDKRNASGKYKYKSSSSSSSYARGHRSNNSKGEYQFPRRW